MFNKQNDQFNRKRLGKYRLPVIKSINQLLDVLNLKDREDLYFFSHNRASNLYNSFYIPKRNGGRRLIESPCKEIRPVLKAIDSVFLRHFELSSACCAYQKGKSIIDNSLPHMGAKTLLKFDIHDFFPSINLKRVVFLFRHFGYGRNVSRYLGYLVVNKDYVLPQGSPTSPMLSNLACVRLDARISGFCEKHVQDLELSYTRYADDITISSKKKLPNVSIKYIKHIIETIVESEGFTPNRDKFKAFVNGQKLSVTGINVNDSNALHVDKKKIREIEIAIHCMKKYGVDSHFEYVNSKREEEPWASLLEYERHIFGLAFYTKMVDPRKGEKYIGELKRIFKQYER